MKKQEKKIKQFSVIKEHFRKNAKQYFIVSIVFLIGIIIGVMFVSNIKEENKLEIKQYLTNFIENIKTNYKIDMLLLLKKSIMSNLLLAITLWFIGSTVVGIPIVYLIIMIRGFYLGYTISAITLTYSFWKGILFSFASLLLQNIIYIPCILALAVSGIKLHKSIVKDKRRDHIKEEIFRHTIFSILISMLLIFSSVIEVYCSANLIQWIAKIL